MNVKGTFKFLGVERFTSVKTGEIFMNACFLQGTEVLKVFINEQSLPVLVGVDSETTVDVELDIRVGQKTYISIVSLVPVLCESIPSAPAEHVPNESTESTSNGKNSKSA